MLQQRPNTFAQTNLLPHFSLATKRRTIHSGLPVTRPESTSSAEITSYEPTFSFLIGDSCRP
jgi:hypothetical protein